MEINTPVLHRAQQRKTSRLKKTLTAYSFVAPNFIGFFVFTMIPLCFALVLSFMHWDNANETKFVGLDNFIRLAVDKTFRKALVNTVIYTAATVPLTQGTGLGLALLLNQKIKARNVFRTVNFFPYVASMVAVTAVWGFLFNPSFGPVNVFLSWITGMPYESMPRWGVGAWALPSVILFSVWKNMGYYMVIYLAGLQGISPSLYEAASIDGANAWQKFVNVTIPQLKPTTFFITMILIINSFKVYDIFITMFGGGKGELTDSTRVLVYQIYHSAFVSWDFGYASAMALVLFVIVLGVTLVQFYSEKKFSAE